MHEIGQSATLPRCQGVDVEIHVQATDVVSRFGKVVQSVYNFHRWGVPSQDSPVVSSSAVYIVGKTERLSNSRDYKQSGKSFRHFPLSMAQLHFKAGPGHPW